MQKAALLVAAAMAGLIAVAQAAPVDQAPQRATAGPGDQTFKTTTLSSEPYEPSTELPKTDPVPNCQIKIGAQWSEMPAQTLYDCADLLDEKSPAAPKPMSTAYWNSIYLSADAKNIYRADPKSSEWTVLKARGGH
ncbi:hypothetical protein [Solimonas marina]|uniref:Uncharacterized protein n=1 Tax=Solimonas marina TaxID=2714601 RepID=A0A970B5M5_9GAMM|nr:hypothetical protein [Solimonas marina]NKF21740.1 hypothetical protein [Solimonas marina]